jgi:hypothetical protein
MAGRAEPDEPRPGYGAGDEKTSEFFEQFGGPLDAEQAHPDLAEKQGLDIHAKSNIEE